MNDLRSYSKEFLTQFIELYKSLPALWKIKSMEYSDRNKKNEGYHLLIEKLKEVEPNATRDTVTKKINSLRSSRRKEKKKVKDSLKSGASTDDIYHPSLWYYDLLEFVDEQKTARNPISNFLDSLESQDNTDTASNTGLSETGSNADETLTSVYSSLEYRPSSQPSTRNSNDLRSPTNEDGRRSSTTTALPPRYAGGKRGRELDDTISSIGKRLRESTKEDSHDAFGRNVAHKLRNLPSNQRIFLEKIINDAIFEAELGNLNRNCYIHVPGSKSLDRAVNPPRISIPVNRTQNSTATILSQASMIPETQLIALQNDNVEVNYDPNDHTTLSQYIVNYKL